VGTDWSDLDPRTPVIAGVGVASQREAAGDGVEAVELMIAAATTAGADSGAPDVLCEVQRVAVPGGSWRYCDPGRIIADRIGAAKATTSLVQTGIPQQTLFDDAYGAILDGTIDVALIVGGEAARRAALARRAGITVVDTEQVDVTPDDLQVSSDEIVTRIEGEGGFASAMAPFAMIDSALRYAEGRSIDEQRDEIATLWAGFNTAAQTFPHAAFPEPRDAAYLREPSETNRPFAFPYNKWHCAQMNVDQAAAIVVCSLEATRRLGVPETRLVRPLVALESSFSLPVSQRRDLHRWPAMEVLGTAAEEHLGRAISALDVVELYSCFPAAVRVQQRALRLPTDGVPTITGGESFAGGPWNNFVLQTTAAMIERLRTDRDATGLVSTVSGLVNKPGLAVYAARPEPTPLLVADLGEEADAATRRVEAISGYEGPATVAAYTVQYDDGEPGRCTAIADTSAGQRVVATAHDPELARRVTKEELIGTTVTVDRTTFQV
jgi:acetyl-CoA C-acetyltransferase